MFTDPSPIPDYYGRLSPDEFRQALRSSGLEVSPQVSASSFTSNESYYVNERATNDFFEYTHGSVGDIKYETYLTRYRNMTTSNLYMMVFAIELPYDTASVYIESKTIMNFNAILGVSKMPPLKGIDKVELEGDFNRYFGVFSQDRRGMEAFLTLAPNIMLRVLESPGNYDIEFAGRYVYIYHQISGISYINNTSHLPVTPQAYIDLLNFGHESADWLARAARPSQSESGDTGRLPIWRVVQNDAGGYMKWFFKWLIGIFAYMALFGIAFFIVAPASAIYVLVRYTQWNTRKTKLLKDWHDGKAILAVKR